MRALWAGVAVALLAEVSINPFGTLFRFSLGPVGLSFFALFFRLPAYLTGAAAGLIVPLVHAGFAIIHNPSLSEQGVLRVVAGYLPETLAYTFLGTLLFAFRVNQSTSTPLRLMSLIALADSLTNVAELIIRPDPIQLRALVMVLIVAVGRAAVSAGVFYILHEEVRARQWAEERRNYMQQLLFICNLQTEAFFLSKSAQEMESIMAKAHRLYRALAGQAEEPLALEIATDIHEVKKDSQRTLSALYRLVDIPKLAPEMNFSEILTLVSDANRTYAATLGKEIELSTQLLADFRTPRFGRWVSILNNLVSNAIEACGPAGTVLVATAKVGPRFAVRVVDTGSGIPKEDWELIFSPGFSTKLNPVTGAFSSGIGLTHVAELVKSMEGSICVEQSGSTGTIFLLEVPWESLEVVENGA